MAQNPVNKLYIHKQNRQNRVIFLNNHVRDDNAIQKLYLILNRITSQHKQYTRPAANQTLNDLNSALTCDRLISLCLYLMSSISDSNRLNASITKTI